MAQSVSLRQLLTIEAIAVETVRGLHQRVAVQEGSRALPEEQKGCYHSVFGPATLAVASAALLLWNPFDFVCRSAIAICRPIESTPIPEAGEEQVGRPTLNTKSEGALAVLGNKGLGIRIASFL